MNSSTLVHFSLPKSSSFADDPAGMPKQQKESDIFTRPLFMRPNQLPPAYYARSKEDNTRPMLVRGPMGHARVVNMACVAALKLELACAYLLPLEFTILHLIPDLSLSKAAEPQFFFVQPDVRNANPAHF